MGNRQSWSDYFMELAEKLATRSTCDRANVGAVLVNDEHRIVSTGYNGSLPNNPHCDEIGHTLRDGHCIATVHAEINAISYCAKEGISLKGTTLYVTHFPCLNCTKSIIIAGISKVFYRNDYRIDEYALKLFKDNNISVEKI
ncbi:MAG: deoxycytidylate deaminase [Clostridium sp.]